MRGAISRARSTCSGRLVMACTKIWPRSSMPSSKTQRAETVRDTAVNTDFVDPRDGVDCKQDHFSVPARGWVKPLAFRRSL